MKIKKIGIFDLRGDIGMSEKNVKSIRDAFPDAEVLYTYELDELISKGGDIDALITWPPLKSRGIDAGKYMKFCLDTKSLKWIHTFTSGVELLMTPEMKASDIIITSTKGVHGQPVADHVLALIFAFLRALPTFFRHQQKHEYNMATGDYCNETFEKTVGIVGLGKIGTHVAKRCKQLEMRVVGLDLYPVKNEWIDHCYSPSELYKLLGECDFVVLNVALTRETENMIDENALKAMKKTAHLINVARGGVVDETALLKALKDGTIAGAGLDVFADEPLPKDSPLWDLENVIITPHIAARSPYYMDRTTEVIIDNLRRFESGDPLMYVADKSEY